MQQALWFHVHWVKGTEEAGLTGGAALLIAFLTLSAMSADLSVSSISAECFGGYGQYVGISRTLFEIIVLPSVPLLAIGMGASGILRGVGDAKRAMYVTLIGAAVTMVIDPILIFGFGFRHYRRSHHNGYFTRGHSRCWSLWCRNNP